MSGVFFWMAQQLAGLKTDAVQPAARNPNPPGTIHDGSTTDAILEVLERYEPRFLTYTQIVDFTGKSPKSVSWSLCYLKSLGRVEARSSSDPRSPLYQMYRKIK
jgi:hypothetical protein